MDKKEYAMYLTHLLNYYRGYNAVCAYKILTNIGNCHKFKNLDVEKYIRRLEDIEYKDSIYIFESILNSFEKIVNKRHSNIYVEFHIKEFLNAFKNNDKTEMLTFQEQINKKLTCEV